MPPGGGGSAGTGPGGSGPWLASRAAGLRRIPAGIGVSLPRVSTEDRCQGGGSCGGYVGLDGNLQLQDRHAFQAGVLRSPTGGTRRMRAPWMRNSSRSIATSDSSWWILASGKSPFLISASRPVSIAIRTMPITWSTALRTSEGQFLGRRKDSASSSSISSGMGMTRTSLPYQSLSAYQTLSSSVLRDGRERQNGASLFPAHDRARLLRRGSLSATGTCTSARVAGKTRGSYSGGDCLTIGTATTCCARARVNMLPLLAFREFLVQQFDFHHQAGLHLG